MQEAFEKIIEQLKTECFLTTNDDGETNELSIKVVALGDAIAIVKETAAEYNNSWISCNSGKQPEECQGVDVTIEETLESGEKKYYTAHSWMQDGVWVVKKNPRHPKVIAWKYPAEPYIPKEN